MIGGIANEIALDEVSDFTPQVNRDTVQLNVPDGPTLTLIADGDGVNYTVGGGNPIEIMDLSFAVQASAVAYLLEHRAHWITRLSDLTQRPTSASPPARSRRADTEPAMPWRTTVQLATDQIRGKRPRERRPIAIDTAPSTTQRGEYDRQHLADRRYRAYR